ncbi:MAG TPA: hypothetical protein DCL34_07930 [Erythrobacter sp.]|nr:hypothetical protein [Erythrobacteraceae bacterium]HAG36723.1 hypothetical protein [Erythrobacter sp.]
MSSPDVPQARGQCPSCSAPITFARANLLRRGVPFGCDACGRQLILPKVSIPFVFGGFVLIGLLGEHVGIWAVLVALVLFSLAEWMRVKVSLAPQLES